MTHLVLEEVVRQVRSLPSLPVIVLELLTSMDHDNASMQFLADKISQDQALAAKTLRLANSSFYGMSSRVATVQQAIAVLGSSTVRTLVTAAAITGQFKPSEFPDFAFVPFWRHGIATAICARTLATPLYAHPDQAFIAGLLHDVGRLVMATRFPAVYALVVAYRDAEDCTVHVAERTIAGVDHADIGAALAAHWRFPQGIVDAVAQHHAAPTGGLAQVVYLADALAHAIDLTDSPNELVPVIPDDTWARNALDEAALLPMLRTISLAYAGIAEALTG